MENKMDWVQIMVLMFGNAAIVIPLFLWNRSESNADRRELRQSMDTQLLAIREEMKDFHGRLCAIEERNRK
jgi:hypothetical protein